MKIVRCKTKKSVSYGVIDGKTIHLLEGEPYSGLNRTGEELPSDDVVLLAPCEPSKIVAIGINYTPHAQELDFDIPPVPLVFF